jgi:hypothetical protein
MGEGCGEGGGGRGEVDLLPTEALTAYRKERER